MDSVAAYLEVPAHLDQPRIFKSLQAAINIIDDLGVPTEIIKIPIIRG